MSTPVNLNQAARARAASARRAAIAGGAHYRRDWLDSDLWDELARARAMRLPQWHRPPTARALKTAARSLGNLDFEAIFGCSPSRAIALNQTAPLRAFIGWLLESAYENLARGERGRSNAPFSGVVEVEKR
jgi:hypothetical protein